MFCRDKRVQMIQELTGLFHVLRETSRRDASNLASSRLTGSMRLHQKPEKYIVDFYDAFSNPEDGVVCLMIEYMDGGSLQDIVDTGGCHDEQVLANISIQALKGLAFLHSCAQIHRDLKPGNFLISHNGEVKVADLGIMKQLPSNQSGAMQKTNTFVGTATYMSPERIDGKEYSFPSDVWAFGLSIMSIALGRLPIDTKGGYWTILHGIRDAEPPQLPPTFPDGERISSELRDFLNKCLQKNPSDRPSCKELLRHPWLSRAHPEDFDMDNKPDRGKQELGSVIRAMVKHINSLKQDIKERYRNEQEYVDSRSVMHEKLFGNVWSTDTLTLVKALLFDNSRSIHPGHAAAAAAAATTTTTLGSASRDIGEFSVGSNKLTKGRLRNLAKQLHMTLDKLTSEARFFCDGIAEETTTSFSDTI